MQKYVATKLPCASASVRLDFPSEEESSANSCWCNERTRCFFLLLRRDAPKNQQAVCRRHLSGLPTSLPKKYGFWCRSMLSSRYPLRLLSTRESIERRTSRRTRAMNSGLLKHPKTLHELVVDGCWITMAFANRLFSPKGERLAGKESNC